MAKIQRPNRSIKLHIDGEDFVTVGKKAADTILSRLIFLGAISKKDRKIVIPIVKRLIKDHNEQLKDFSDKEDRDRLSQELADRRTYNSILNMLFEISSGVYDGSYCPRRKTFDSLLAGAFPNYETVSLVQRLWSRGIEVQKVDPTLRADLLCSGRWLDGGEILDILNSLHRSIKSMLVTNPIILLFLSDFIASHPELKQLWIEIPRSKENSSFDTITEQRGANLLQQKNRHRIFQDSIEKLVNKFGDRIDIRVRYSELIVLYSTSLVVTNIDTLSGEYGNCISTDVLSGLFEDKCQCKVEERDDVYISKRVQIATS